MAKSNVFSTSNQYIKYGIEVIENSVNTQNNSSNVTVKVLVWRTNQGYETYGTGTIYLTINGVNYSYGIWRDKVISYNSYTPFYTGTANVTHNDNGTKNMVVSARIDHSQFTTATNTFTTPLTTIARYATISQTLANKTETTLTVQWSTDSTVDQLYYSLDSGTNWTSVVIADSNGGTFTIEGLDAGTEYSILTKVRRKDNGLYSTSSALTVSTYDYPYATAMPNFIIGESLTIGLYNPLNRLVTVSMVGADYSEYGEETTSGTQISGFNSVSWQTWLYSTIPNALSGSYQIKVAYGEIESTETGGTYSVNSSDALPVIGTASYEDTNAFTVHATGDASKIIRNQSTVQYTASGLAGSNDSTVTACTVTVNGNTYDLTISGTTATGNGGVIDSAYDVQAVFTVVDSRGIINTKTVTITMLDWTLPSAIITLQRKNNFYSETYITVDADFSYIEGANQGVITYKARKAGTSTYTISGTLQDNVTSTFTADNNYEWEVVVELTDIFNVSVEYNAFLSRGVPIIYFDRLKSSVGINCFPQGNNSFEVNGLTIFDMIYPVGSVYQSTDSSNPSSIFGGTWTQLSNTNSIYTWERTA